MERGKEKEKERLSYTWVLERLQDMPEYTDTARSHVSYKLVMEPLGALTQCLALVTNRTDHRGERPKRPFRCWAYQPASPAQPAPKLLLAPAGI